MEPLNPYATWTGKQRGVLARLIRETDARAQLGVLDRPPKRRPKPETTAA